MPYLPLYLLDSDIDLLNDWLCKDEEEAFLAVLELELEVAQLKPVEKPVTA